MSDYIAARERLRHLRAELKIVGRREFDQLSKRLFEEHPTLQSFSWKQYTPYFNDGDTCEFSAHTDVDSIQVNDVWGDDIESTEPYDPELRNWDAYKEGREEGLKLHKAVASFLQVFDEEDLETFFGDHVKVTIHRDGEVDTKDHHHD